MSHSDAPDRPEKMGRRRFLDVLRGAGPAMGLFAFESALSRTAVAAPGGTEIRTRYPAKVVGRIDELAVGQPVSFTYPDADHACLLFKVGKPAEGGIGPEQDVVAFSTLCPHMGCELECEDTAHGTIVGPCRCHLSSFDPTRSGLQIQGQATQSLPQIALELAEDGSGIVATGINGLVYGRHHNVAG